MDKWFVSLGLAIVLTCSFKILEFIISRALTKTKINHFKRNTVYVWGFFAIAAACFYEENYVFNLPINFTMVLSLTAVVFIANVIVSRHSGYRLESKFNRINFIIAYPIIEEIIFRGLMLPILNQAFVAASSYELFYLPVTLPILISSLLFAVSHLQYYTLNKLSVRFMFFAFIGGIIFGTIADITQSIFIPVLLHIQYNLLSVYYSRKVKI
ncbi:CPBP family intramembrane glutamic endopeptidase [Paenibacillus sp. FSL K6-3182]|uniref:CPBP family intramembrane glutamic endopeptidase n=1 Tax=unclassified Paenibacillus TaxID=185978 RepID=UPI0030D486FC